MSDSEYCDLILGISTSSHVGSIAWINIYEKNVVHSESWSATKNPSENLTNNQSAQEPRAWSHTAALPSIFAKKRDLLARTQHIAVGLGPGSFSGIRAGIVAAQALQLHRDIPITGICCHDVIASTISDLDHFSIICDARRDFAAISHYTNKQRIAGPQLVSWEDLKKIASTRTLISSEQIYNFPNLKIIIPHATDTAKTYLKLSYKNQNTLPLEPIYLHEVKFKKISDV